jgi:HEAT repeat protein
LVSRTKKRDSCFIGDIIGHVAVIPVLERIARDQKENEYIRAAAVRAIALIPDEQAIEVLIGILDEAEKAFKQNPKDAGAREVEGAAWEVLGRLLGLPIEEIDSKKSKADNIRSYWRKVRNKIDLRKSVYVLKALTH